MFTLFYLNLISPKYFCVDIFLSFKVWGCHTEPVVQLTLETTVNCWPDKKVHNKKCLYTMLKSTRKYKTKQLQLYRLTDYQEST